MEPKIGAIVSEGAPLTGLPTGWDGFSTKRKRTRHTLELVEDHQLIFEARKVKLGVGEFRQIRGALQIEIVTRFAGIQVSRQGGFPHLPRSQYRDCWRLLEPLEQG